MLKNKKLILAALMSGLFCAPAQADSDRYNERGEYREGEYREGEYRRGDRDDDFRRGHEERHNMGMDMMEMLRRTMTILHDLNHKPSATEKAQLKDMINQLGSMMEHKQDKYDKRTGEGMGRPHRRGDHMMMDDDRR